MLSHCYQFMRAKTSSSNKMTHPLLFSVGLLNYAFGQIISLNLFDLQLSKVP